ncbi:MAG: hypothetical protein FGM14_10285 [Flavobacteriales bacterium]|nr:hypothetical protein [Flavobacteriales bacterium]
MKSVFKLSFLAVFISFFYSCSEKVNLVGDFKETAVVYGLLDHSDSIHFIKITRAFIGPGNALEIAKIPDSSYFNQVEATVSEFVNGNLTRTWVLEDTIVENKDTNGAFYGPEQKVYYFRTLPTTVSSSGLNGVIQTSPNPQLTSLNPDATYKFKAIINGGEFEVTGETELVKGITTTTASQNFTFKFANNPGEYISTGVAVSNSGNSFVVNTQLDIAFNEHRGNDITEKRFNWQLGEVSTLPGTAKTFSALGQSFYDLIKANASNDPTITKRTFNGIYVTVTGGAEELYNYMVVNQPSSTLAQSKPNYTNLTVSNGKRVVGIFSSRQTIKIFKPFYVSAQQAFIRAIDKKSTRELCQGPITGTLLFCSNHPGDNVINQEESFACQ